MNPFDKSDVYFKNHDLILIFIFDKMSEKWWNKENNDEIEDARILNNYKKRDLLDKKLFIFDQDGTIYLNYILLDGAKDFINILKKKKKKFVFITNNSSKKTDTYREKLTGILNIKINLDQIYNSTLATIEYLKNQKISKIYCMGTQEFIEEINKHGLICTEEDPQLIVVAFDTTLTYEKLKKTCFFIQNGLEYIATHPDKVCPTSDGFIPDTGSFISLIESATGIKPKKVLGKPNPEIISFLLEKYQIKPKECIVFGDRIYTDIKMGKKCGTTTALMLTGESKIHDIEKFNIEPDLVFRSFNEVINLFNEKS